MADEQLFRSLMDRFDTLFDRRAAKESQYLNSLGERMENALGKGFSRLDNAVTKVEESVERSLQEQQNVELEAVSPRASRMNVGTDALVEGLQNIQFQTPQISNVQEVFDSLSSSIEEESIASIEEFSEKVEAAGEELDAIDVDSVTESIQAGMEAEREGFGFMEQISRSIESMKSAVMGAFETGPAQQTIEPTVATEKLEEQLEEFEVEGGSLSTVQETITGINESYTSLAQSSKVSGEAVNQFDEAYGEFVEEIQQVQELVLETDIGTEEAEQQVQSLLEEVGGQFEEIFGDELEKSEEIVAHLQELSGRFAHNMRKASQQAREMEGLEGAGFLEVMSQVSEVGGRFTLTEMAENLEGGVEQAKVLKDTIQGANAQMTALRAGAFALVGALGMASDLVEDAYDGAREFREETGIGADRMREIRDLAAQTSAELAGFGLSPAATTEILGEMREVFGSVQTASKLMGETQEQLVERSAALAGRLGVSAHQAAEIRAEFSEIQKTTGASADQLTTATIELAEQNEVAPTEALEDIAENSQALAKFAGGGAQELAKAAVEAQRLGTNLGEVTAFQEKALSDITGTVQQFQQAQMLTGQAFDSAKLLQASYQGTAETVEQIGKQLKGINFENLDYFQTTALEDAFGMDAKTLATIAKGEKKLKDLNTTAARSRALAQGDITFAQAVNADDVDEVARLSRQFNQLYFVIAEELYPVLSDLVEAVLPGLTATLQILQPLLSGIATGFKLLLSPLQGVSAGMQLLMGNVDRAKETWEGFKSSVYDVIKPVVQVTDFVGQYLGLDLAGKLSTEKEKFDQIESAVGALKTAFEGLLVGFGTYWAGKSLASLLSGGGFVGKVGGWIGSITGLGDAFKSLKFKVKKAAFFMREGWRKAVEVGSKATSRLGTALSNAGQAISNFGSRLVTKLPSLQKMGALLRLGRMRAMSFVTRIPLLGGAMSTLSAAMSTAATSTYAFATSLSATGIGAIILGIAAAIGGAVAAFYNWEETVQFVKDTFNSFMSTAFGVENATKKLSSAVSAAGEWFSWLGSVIWDGTLDAIYAFGDALQWVYTTLQLDHIAEFVGYIGGLIGKFYEAKTAGEALGSTLGVLASPLNIIVDRVGDAINLFSEWIELVWDLGSAIAQGNFGDIGSILVEGIGDVGSALIDAIFPDSLQSYVASKMEGITSTITSYLPFSPAETGPLAALDEVNIGGEIATNIDTEKVQAAMESMGTQIKQTAEMVLPEPVVEGASDVVSAVYNAFTGGGGGEQAAQQATAQMSAQTVTIQTDAIQQQAQAGQFAQPQVRQEAGMIQTVEQMEGRTIEPQGPQPTEVNVDEGGTAVQGGTAGGGGQLNIQPATQQPPQMNVQPAQTDVATISEQATQPVQQDGGGQQEIRVDSDTTNMEDLLRQIRNSQQQLTQALKNGNIAVYLDGRKVNKEMLRDLNVVE